MPRADPLIFGCASFPVSFHKVQHVMGIDQYPPSNTRNSLRQFNIAMEWPRWISMAVRNTPRSHEKEVQRIKTWAQSVETCPGQAANQRRFDLFGLICEIRTKLFSRRLLDNPFEANFESAAIWASGVQLTPQAKAGCPFYSVELCASFWSR